MKLFTAFVLLLLSGWGLVNTAHGQTYGRFGHIAVGYDGANFDAVNAWMPTGLGYPMLRNNFVSFGLDQYFVTGNTLIGWQLQSKVGRRVNSERGSMRPYEFAGMIQAGYIVTNTKRLVVYPTLGVGYGAFGNHIFNTRKKYPDFIPSEPRRRENVVLINRGLVGSIAISADYYVRQQLTERNKGFTIGLRAGYDYRPKTDRWQANAETLASGPEFAAAGPFIRVLLGIGNIGPRR